MSETTARFQDKREAILDCAARLFNQRRLLALKRNHAEEVHLFSGHDLAEYERLSGRSARIPAEAFTRSTPGAVPAGA